LLARSTRLLLTRHNPVGPVFKYPIDDEGMGDGKSAAEAKRAKPDDK
jgi:hypothetical protein